MASNKENQRTSIGTDDDPTRGRPYHDSETAELKKLLAAKVIMDRQVKLGQEALYKREGEYLESTPNGNILIGFENYMKPGNTVRKVRDIDSLRVFSKPFIPLSEAADSPASSVQTTPSHAPTPVSSSFQKGDGSAAATPNSGTTSGHGRNGGAGSSKRSGKRGDEESEIEGKDVKKGRVASGSSRK